MLATLPASFCICGANYCRQWWVGDPFNFVDERAVADSDVSFQMVSLLKLAKVTEEGVRFLSPHDGSPMYATNGRSLELKLTTLGS